MPDPAVFLPLHTGRTHGHAWIMVDSVGMAIADCHIKHMGTVSVM